MIRVKNPQDFWAGILFVGFGGAALWIGRVYAFGTLSKMGPGYLPAVLSGALLVIGGVLIARALAIGGPPIERSKLIPQLFILAAIVVFAGSLPRGVTPDLYASLIRELERLELTTVIDTDGEPLRQAVRALHHEGGHRALRVDHCGRPGRPRQTRSAPRRTRSPRAGRRCGNEQR